MARFNWAPYQPATYCYGEPQRGTVYLGVFLTENFAGSYVGNIYSCRDIVGGSDLSHHAEGRADDQMTVRSRPPNGVSQAEEMLEMLGPYGRVLGLDHLILNLEPWAGDRGEPMVYNERSPMGRPYTGPHPHKDHNHNGQTRWGAANVTLSDIRRIVLGTPVPIPQPVPTPTPPTMEDVVIAPITPSSHPQMIGLLQEQINQTFYQGGGGLTLESPPRWGNGTSSAVKKWLVPLTNDPNPEVKAGRYVNFRMANELDIRWHKARGL